jgi:hypothetical protein
LINDAPTAIAEKQQFFDLHQSIGPVADYHYFAGQGARQEEEP